MKKPICGLWLVLFCTGPVFADDFTAAYIREHRKGYSPRPCGFDMDRNGVLGEPADRTVADGKTRDPDGDGVDEDLFYVDSEAGSDQTGDGQYPPYDADDTAVLDGRNMLAWAVTEDRKLSHVYIHDVELYAINKGEKDASGKIVLSFWGGPMTDVAFINNLVDDYSSYFCRGAPPDRAGRFRFQNNTLKMHGTATPTPGNPRATPAASAFARGPRTGPFKETCSSTCR